VSAAFHSRRNLPGPDQQAASHRKRRSRLALRHRNQAARARRLWAEPLESRCLLDSGGAAGLLSSGNLTYGSGPLIQNVQIEPIFLKDTSSGKSAQASERAALDSFFNNIAAGSYIPSLLSQYSAGGQTIGAGSKGANDIDVPVTRDSSFTSVKNGNTYSAISDSTIRNVIANQIAQGNTAPVTANTLYFVFTPPGTPVVNNPSSATGNSVDGDGGYSSYFSLGGQNVYYAVVFDPGAPNASLSDLGFGSLASQQLTVVASHELADAITDPLSNLSANHGTGWFDRGLNQQVADLAHTQIYTQDGNVVQYQWSQQSLGPAHAPGTAGNHNNLFINQLTPPAVDTFAGGPVATFTSTNPNLTASSFKAYVSFNGFEGLQPATVSGGNNGVYVISATPSAPLGDGQYGAAFPNNNYLQNGGMEIYVFDQADGGVASNAPLSARYAPYAVSVAASLIYNADAGGLAHNFRLVKNAGSGNFELYDNNNLVFTQPIAQTFDIEIGADPGVDSSLTLDYSGGAFNVPITFDGGSGAGQHALTVTNGTFAQESYSATGPDSGTFGLDGQAVTVSHVTSANIPTTLAITTSLQTILAGQASTPITVQLQDPFGNPITAGAGGVTVQLSTTSSGGSFLTTSGQPLGGNTVTIAAGANSSSFEYKDTQPGTPTLNATAPSNHPASLSPATYTLNIASFFVTTAADEDNGSPNPALGTGTSLREAIKAANSSSGLDFIAFNIPGSGVHTISTTGLTITDSVIIDGYTQPGASPNSLAIGDNAALLIEIDSLNDSLQISGPGASGSSIKGLAINDFGTFSGISITNSSNNTFAGNFVGLAPDGTTVHTGSGLGQISISGGSGNTIGGTNPADRNVIASTSQTSIYIKPGSNGNFVQGNYIGVDRTGTTAVPANEIFVQQSNDCTIGGDTPGAGNVIGNWAFGNPAIELGGSDGSVVQGNLLGTDATGTVALNPNAVGAIEIFQSTNSQIGGSTAGAGNIISGVKGYGIRVDNVGPGTVIQGNKIGTDVTGTKPIGNGMQGIWIVKTNNASGGLIGGTSPVEGNIIAFNGKEGVLVSAGSNWSILGNSLFANGTLGIDLGTSAGADGITPNDTGDADTGPNNLQNFPVISYATRDAANLKVTYNVPSVSPNSTFPIRVEFFLADANGQGQTYLGFDTLNGPGDKTATISIATPIHVFDKIVATATDSQPAAAGGGPANTSEFSPNITIVSPWQNPGHLRWDVNDDTHVAADDVLTIINRINSAGSGPLPDDAKNEPPYYDVDGDNNVVAADVLNVINYINAGRPLGGGEAEAAWDGEAPAEPSVNQSPVATDQSLATTDVMALLAADIAAQGLRKRK
jgi:CSLREA domain-containing protein